MTKMQNNFKVFTASDSFNLSISCLNWFHLENVCAVDFCNGFKTGGLGLKPEIECIGWGKQTITCRNFVEFCRVKTEIECMGRGKQTIICKKKSLNFIG